MRYGKNTERNRLITIQQMKTLKNDKVLNAITKIAKKHRINRIILFGSRARGDNTERSDYDIAVSLRNPSPLEEAKIYDAIQSIETLKKIDLVFLENQNAEELSEQIKKEGITLYEESKQTQ